MTDYRMKHMACLQLPPLVAVTFLKNADKLTALATSESSELMPLI